MEGFTSGSDRKCRAVAVCRAFWALNQLLLIGKVQLCSEILSFSLTFSSTERKISSSLFQVLFLGSKGVSGRGVHRRKTRSSQFYSCLMESHAVSGQKIEKPTNLKQKTKPQQPNQKTQPKNQTNFTTPRPCLKEETQRAAQAYWETLQKGSLLFISMQPSRIFLSGHQTSWAGKWYCPEVDLNASVYRPESPNLCCRVYLTHPVMSPHPGPGSSAHQSGSRSTVVHLLWKAAIIWLWMHLPLGEKGMCKDQGSISTWCGTTLRQPQQPRNGLNVNALIFLNVAANLLYQA